MFTTSDIINIAIRIENSAEKLLRNAAPQMTDPSLVSLLHWLADEEVKHVQRFSELRQVENRTIHDPKLEAAGKAIIEGALGEQTFSLNDVDFSKIDQPEDVLERIIEFENDTILFYELLRSFVAKKENLELLDVIIEEEKSHIRLLEEVLNSETSDTVSHL
jgi:rubrerythrin